MGDRISGNKSKPRARINPAAETAERPEHNPVGDPCILCKKVASRHRVDHPFAGRVKCTVCGLPVKNHRLREKPKDTRQRSARKPQARTKQPTLFLGIDGEGQGRERHKYVLLAAANEAGDRTFKVENPDGLTAEECLWFLYRLPRRARLFGYSLNYDLTKMLQSLTLTNEGRRVLFLLFRPELRPRFGKEARKGPWPLLWKGWTLNLQGTKFSFGRSGPGGHKRILWDIWKFYQSKFVTALEDWKIGTPEERALIEHMKDHRSEFDKQRPEDVERYCFLECSKMAEQVRCLIDAHREAGLPLKTFYGAGSTASVLLEQMGVRNHIAAVPEAMAEAVACAFSGGRFELGRLGRVRGPVYAPDISSAYPYQLCRLPCLVHGRWEHTTSRQRFDRSKWALVRYEFDDSIREERAWGPLPFRFPKGHKEAGSICYPKSSGGGWVYQDEFREAERLFPEVVFREAWVFTGECECMPFLQIPHVYLRRLFLGKEGPGIPLKLGPNSCYGKLAQSVGRGQYNSWVWAGMITSGCRAQGLHALGLHRDWSNCLMFATDGLLSLEKLVLPAPVETGTFGAYECKAHKRMCGECPEVERTYKPLGGWESNTFERGVFLARPGVYFPLEPTEKDLRKLRGRGVGRKCVLSNHKTIMSAYEDWNGAGEWPTVELNDIDRFCGAKTSTSRTENPAWDRKTPGERWLYHVAEGNHWGPPEGWHAPLSFTTKPRYGEWVSRKVVMSFDPMPKRAGLRADGSLRLRELPRDMTSAPYSKAVLSDEAKELIALALAVSEQPDGDLGEYELE